MHASRSAASRYPFGNPWPSLHHLNSNLLCKYCSFPSTVAFWSLFGSDLPPFSLLHCHPAIIAGDISRLHIQTETNVFSQSRSCYVIYDFIELHSQQTNKLRYRERMTPWQSLRYDHLIQRLNKLQQVAIGHHGLQRVSAVCQNCAVLSLCGVELYFEDVIILRTCHGPSNQKQADAPSMRSVTDQMQKQIISCVNLPH